MPDFVLRNKKLPGQPYVVSVPFGGQISYDFKAAGWELDTKTTPEDAIAEAQATTEGASLDAEKAQADWVPDFAPDPAAAAPALAEPTASNAPSAPTTAPTDPNQPAQPVTTITKETPS